MTGAASPPRGECSECKRLIALKADGTVRHHMGPKDDRDYFGRRRYRCDGSGMWPAAPSTDVGSAS